MLSRVFGHYFCVFAKVCTQDFKHMFLVLIYFIFVTGFDYFILQNANISSEYNISKKSE